MKESLADGFNFNLVNHRKFTEFSPKLSYSTVLTIKFHCSIGNYTGNPFTISFVIFVGYISGQSSCCKGDDGIWEQERINSQLIKHNSQGKPLIAMFSYITLYFMIDKFTYRSLQVSLCTVLCNSCWFTSALFCVICQTIWVYPSVL